MSSQPSAEQKSTPRFLDRGCAFRKLADAIDHPMWVADREGKLLFANDPWRIFRGMSPDEYSEGWWQDTLCREDHDVWEEAWQEALRDGRRFVCVVGLKGDDDRHCGFEVRVEPVIDEPSGEVYWCGTCVKLDGRRVPDSNCFRRLADNAPAMLWMIDASYQCTFVSRGWCEFTGQTQEEALGYGWREAIHPADRAQLGASFRGVAAREGDYQGEFRLRTADGDYRWVASSARPLPDIDGAAAGYVGSLIDVHEAKLAQEESRQARELLQAVTEATPDLVFAQDRQGRVILANQAVLSVAEMPRERVLGRALVEFISDASQAEELQASSERVMESGEAEMVEEVLTTSEGERIFQTTKSPLRDAEGEVVGLVGISRDVTQRRHVEDGLRYRERLFRDLADNIAPLAWMADPSGSVFWFNRRWKEFTGMSGEQMRGWGWMSLNHPDHVDRVRERITRSVAAGETWEDTFPLRGRDGSYRWFLCRAVPIHDDDGELVRWFGTSTDVTEKQEVEESLTRADRRKDEFLATLAHELRNPLAPIRHGVEVIRRHQPAEPAILEIVDVIDRQSRTLTQLVDDLLEVSRITRGKVELRRAPVLLSEIVADALEASRPLIRGRGHTLEVDVPADDLMVHGDRLRLAQVMTNLLNNAAKYTPPGGLIEVSAQAEGEVAYLRVRDTGVGVAPEDMERLFEMFCQVRSQWECSAGGLGIGLALVKALVELHGGTIQAFSPGRDLGSEFVITLPLVDPSEPTEIGPSSSSEEPSAQRDDAAAATATKASGRILIVDDNVDAAASLDRLLRWTGHTTCVIHDGPEAVDAVARFRPDVVLLDIGLPTIDGYEVARRIRALEGGEAITLIAQTGWGMERDKVRAREAGFDHHLTKPVDLDELTALIARGLAKAGS